MNHQIVLETIKRLLKAKKMSYKELAEEIGMTESGVKKLFTAKDVSLGRLSHIAEVLGISLSALITLADETEIKSVKLTEKQQTALLNHPILLRILWRMTIEGHSQEDVQKTEKLKSRQLHQYLLKLATLDLIRVNKNGKISPTTRGLYKWIDDGQLLKKINSDWSKLTLSKVLKNKDSEGNLHRLSFFLLTPETKKTLLQKVEELADEFARCSQKEKLQHPKNHLRPVSLLMALSPSGFLDP